MMVRRRRRTKEEVKRKGRGGRETVNCLYENLSLSLVWEEEEEEEE